MLWDELVVSANQPIGIFNPIMLEDVLVSLIFYQKFFIKFLKYFIINICLDCNCNKTGTVSLLNDCNKITGQCICKRHATGIKCDQCADGFYNMQSNNHVGCQRICFSL